MRAAIIVLAFSICGVSAAVAQSLTPMVGETVSEFEARKRALQNPDSEPTPAPLTRVWKPDPPAPPPPPKPASEWADQTRKFYNLVKADADRELSGLSQNRYFDHCAIKELESFNFRKRMLENDYEEGRPVSHSMSEKAKNKIRGLHASYVDGVALCISMIDATFAAARRR